MRNWHPNLTYLVVRNRGQEAFELFQKDEGAFQLVSGSPESQSGLLVFMKVVGVEHCCANEYGLHKRKVVWI